MNNRSKTLVARAHAATRRLLIIVVATVTAAASAGVALAAPSDAAVAHVASTKPTLTTKAPASAQAGAGPSWAYGTPGADGSVTTSAAGWASDPKQRSYSPSDPPASRAIDVPAPRGTDTAADASALRSGSATAALRDAHVTQPHVARAHSIGTPNGTFVAPSASIIPYDNSPSDRGWAMMAYDASNNTDVLFGGTSGTTGYDLNETWTFNGTTWTQQAPTTSPSARDSGMMAYDAASGTVILFGGVNNGSGGNGDTLSDTWSWNGSDWTQLSPSTVPTDREDASFAYDPSLSEIIMFGGNQLVGNVSQQILGDTWAWNGTNWSALSPTTSPAGRFGADMAYDNDSADLVLFGGLEAGTGTNNNETWTFNGTTWTQVTTSPTPSGRMDFGLAWDSAMGTLILYGGYENATGTYDGDEWAFDGTYWYQGAAYVNAGPRQWPDLAPDPTGGLLLYGGATASLDYGDTNVLGFSGIGTRKGYSFDHHAVDDRTTASVNLASRDVMVNDDLADINSAGHGVSIDATYNSRSGGTWAMGPDWTLDVGADVFTSPEPDGDIVVVGLSGGDEAYFTKTTSACPNLTAGAPSRAQRSTTPRPASTPSSASCRRGP